MNINMREAWNRASATYQQNQQISIDSVYYGAWSSPESELQILGDVQGKKILDLGCGGGQSAIALARQGAIVTGVDRSDAQLRFARTLAQNHQVSVQFLEGDAADLGTLQSETWDIALSVNLFQYVADIESALAECYRVLKIDGQMIISLDHPLRTCFIDEEEHELAIYPVRDYFDKAPLHWQFSDSAHWMISYHRTLSEWITLFHAAGFRLQRLVEPPIILELADELWPLDGPLAALRNLPQTIIFIVEKCLLDRSE